MALYTYPGNIHIHSTYSDGSGSVKQIAIAAARAGLSYVIITDHETLEGLAEEGLYSKVVTLVGIEVNRPHSHYLAFGLPKPPAPDPENPQTVIDFVRAGGGLGFIAHPFEKGSPYLEKGQAYPWINWPVFGFTGLEIWNYSSHWRGLHSSLLMAIYFFFFNRKAAMRGAPPELLALWDCYTRSGYRVVGIGGTDAHAFIYHLGFLTLQIFSYQFLFGTINTYLLLEEELAEDFQVAKTQILTAIKDGRCYISFDSLAKGSGFNFYAASAEKCYLMGSTLAYAPGLVLAAEIPVKRAFFRLIRDGEAVYSGSGSCLHFPVQMPGIYRLEVFLKPLIGQPRPWIYSNPIFINKAE
ncbi:MAG: hypothetical protein FJ152_04240 [Firmicutes bacterium]|nr:hypothetical protein [Bacillota bacterium]